MPFYGFMFSTAFHHYSPLPLKASWHPRKANAQPALNILRLFVERFVASEIKTLRGFTYGGNGKCQAFLSLFHEMIGFMSFMFVVIVVLDVMEWDA